MDFALGNCLFGAGKLSKNNDPDKYGYSCYGIVFDTRLQGYGQTVARVKMLLIFVLILGHVSTLIIKIKIS